MSYPHSHTQWAIDPARCTDTTWSAYRVEINDGKYGNYEHRTFPKQRYTTSESLLSLLNRPIVPQSTPASNPFRKGEAQDNSTQDVTGQMGNLSMGYGYPNNPANPNAGPSSNPFRNPTNNPQGYPSSPSSSGYRPSSSSSTSSRRSHTPLPPSQNRQSGSSGFQPHQRQQSNTMSIGSSIRRATTTAPTRGPRLPPMPRNFKAVKFKDQRSFFKAGRVFKAFWSDETNPNGGEFLRFLVIRPFKHHSTCLAIHSYQNKATTARSVRARDHVVIHSTETPPQLVRGEDRVILNRDPLRVRLSEGGEALKETSRLNLSKIYTIEHSILCAGIGRISSRDVERVRTYVSQVQGLSFPVGDDDDDEDEPGG